MNIISHLVQNPEGSTAVFIRRSYETLQEDQPRKLVTYRDTHKAKAAIILATGVFSDDALNYCKEHDIETFDRPKLERI